ncbi:hypothetical protein FRB99_007056 [Tulasnella sp. 403]|nr:hypothetical protein FRB99_007056 [Tulasnella sp. 403]
MAAFVPLETLSFNVTELIMTDGSISATSLHITHYCRVAITMLVLYDTLITLDVEIFYVWSSPWTSSKVVFLLNRYLAPVVCLYNLSTLFFAELSLLCFANAFVSPLMNGVVTCVITFIMGQTWAVKSKRNYIIFGLFVVLFVVSVLFCVYPLIGVPPMDSAVAWAFGEQSFYAANPKTPGAWIFDRCGPPPIFNEALFTIAIPLLFESTLFAFMCYRVIRSSKTLPTSAIVGLTSGSAIVFIIVSPYTRAVVSSQYSVLIRSLMCSRLLLRMRGYFNQRSRVLDGEARTDVFGGIPTRDIITSISTVIDFAHQHPRRVDGTSEFDEWMDAESHEIGDHGMAASIVDSGKVLEAGGDPRAGSSE